MSVIIDNEPRDYAWGGPRAIQNLRGQPSIAYHTGRHTSAGWASTDPAAPEAELWLGTHPSWPSIVVSEPFEGLTLPEALKACERPPELGYLLKLLTVERPLSLQVHPDDAQARDGYARENAMGIPVGDATRNYRDPHPKPEMLLALSDQFELCAGIREVDDILIDLRRAGRSAERDGSATRILRAFWQEFADTLIDQRTVDRAVHWLLDDGASRAAEVTDAIVQRSRSGAATFGIERDTLIRRLDECFPGDVGIALSLLLRHELLRRGQAIYLEPGTPHFYIRGAGIELMGPSDNVVRAGLTGKHVDRLEAMRLMQTVPSAPRHLFEYHKGATTVFHAAGAGLRLAHATAGAGEHIALPFEAGDAVYVLSGSAVIEDRDGSRQTLHHGQAAILIDALRLELHGGEHERAQLVLAGATLPEA